MASSSRTHSSVCLIAVVSGQTYEQYAQRLFESAKRHVHLPDGRLTVLPLPGRTGWPDATMYRYHAVLEHQGRIPDGLVLLSDADMLFESDVGPELLALPHGDAELVATLHPGYVGKARHELPYENRPESVCFVDHSDGGTYYCGGFVGGSRAAFLDLASRVSGLIDEDRERGITPRWHDESALNRALVNRPPDRTLSPAYCHPDDDQRYRGWWPEDYPRILVALDKSVAERHERERVRRSLKTVHRRARRILSRLTGQG